MTIARVKVAVAGSLGLFAMLLSSSEPASAAGSCQTSGPSSGAYTVTVCITQPGDGSTVSGAVPVTATATISGSSPGIDWPTFNLDGSYFTISWYTPAQITIPTAKYVDGSHTLGFYAKMNDGFNSAMATVRLVFSNGVTSPPVNTNTFHPTFSTPAPGQAFTVAAVGDGAIGTAQSDQVGGMMQSWNPNLFMYLGDVYSNGSVGDFYNWYGHSNSFFSRLNAV